MKRIIFNLIVILFFSIHLKGQDASFTLNGLFSRMAKTADDNTRIGINDSITIIIDQYAASDSVFDHRFDSLRYLGQMTSSDKMLKIITWNLVLSENTNEYFCYIILKGEKKEKNAIYRLSGTNSDGPVRSDAIYSSENWYGALYYDLSPLKIKNETYYILLGIDFGKNFINRKMIDVLSFTPDGKIIFGRNWFDNGKQILPRVVFEYDATGVMSLKFHSPRSIVFNHLVPLSIRDDLQSFGADFTLDSYTFRNGIWKFEKNVDFRNKE